jgi:hypothetical protein
MIPLAKRLRSGAHLALSCATLLPFGVGPSVGQSNEPAAFEQIVPGLLGRTVFKTEAGATTVEIIDLVVGPGKSSESLTLTGGALLDVQAGEASLLIDGKQQRVRAGNTVTLAENQSIAIDNARASRPLVARLILLTRPGG